MHGADEFDLFLSWALDESVPDRDPSPRVWEAIEARLAQGVSSEEVRPLLWRGKARMWLGRALSSIQTALLSWRFRLDEVGVWAPEQYAPAPVMISVSAAPWPLYSLNSQIVILGFQTRSGAKI